MEQEHKNWKPLLIAAVAAVAVVALLLVLFFSGGQSAAEQTIVLPEPSAAEKPPQSQPEPPSAQLYEITRENVQSVLEKSVARPASYHQSMQLSILAGSAQRTQSVELWVEGSLIRAQITDAFETKTILANADTLYLWYDDEAPITLARSESMGADALAGIPSYESILALSAAQITQAAFVTLTEPEADCIYVSAQEEQLQQEYWVSLESGLLCKQMMLCEGELVYLMEQTALEIFPEHDEALADVFCLPDGTQPFAQASTEA